MTAKDGAEVACGREGAVRGDLVDAHLRGPEQRLGAGEPRADDFRMDGTPGDESEALLQMTA